MLELKLIHVSKGDPHVSKGDFFAIIFVLDIIDHLFQVKAGWG